MLNKLFSRSASFSPKPQAAASFFSQPKSFWILVAVLVSIVALRLLTLNSYALIDSTEGRYSDIGREMVTLNNWIMPHLDPGTPFWGKPPLSFWATALSLKVFGLNEFAARFPGFLFSMAALVALMVMVRVGYGWKASVRSGIILSTCGLFFAMAAGVLTDPALLFCVSLTMVSFALAVIIQRWQKPAGYLFFAGLGLGVLAKGLVGLIIPGVGIFFWLLIYGGLPSLKLLPWKLGIPLFLLIVIPWHVAAEMNSPGFLEYYIIGEHFLRFVDKGWEGDLYGNPHEEPKGMVWVFGAISAMPWTLLVLAGVYGMRKHLKKVSDPLLGFALLWGLSPLLFFTMSDNVIITYALPTLPGIALCVERWLSRWESISSLKSKAEQGTHRVPLWRSVPVVALVFALLGNLIVLIVLRPIAEERSQKQIVHYFYENRESYQSGLIYFKNMEYSGDFYSNGIAEFIDDDNTAGMMAQLEDGSEDFYVVDDGEMDDFESFAPGLLVLEQFGEFTIYSDRDLKLPSI